MTWRELPARLRGPGLLSRLRHPQTTVRWRLTLLYGGLFLVCGAGLLAITYTLVAKSEVPRPVGFPVSQRDVQFQVRSGTQVGPPTLPETIKTRLPPDAQALLRSPAGGAVLQVVGQGQRLADLHQLVVWSGIALAIMAVISAALGWLVAGRVLAPLRTITATTQQISEANLHQRLAIPGPRDELRRLADTIDGLLERLERAFDAQRRFVANASHELRTPLTAARAVLEMAISDPHATVETFRETCRQALEEGEQQERLIDALLALAQGQRGIDRREPIDLAGLTGRVVRSYEPDAVARRVSLDATLEPAGLTGDPRLIERLVSNLVENAIRHNHADGCVDVVVGEHAGQAALAVANTGRVVPTADVERLLQPFQRLAPDRVGGPDGLGLGLSIVAAIAGAHGAALDVQPGQRGGLRVEVRFPAPPPSLPWRAWPPTPPRSISKATPGTPTAR